MSQTHYMVVFYRSAVDSDYYRGDDFKPCYFNIIYGDDLETFIVDCCNCYVAQEPDEIELFINGIGYNTNSGEEDKYFLELDNLLHKIKNQSIETKKYQQELSKQVAENRRKLEAAARAEAEKQEELRKLAELKLKYETNTGETK